jgi:hypothetical protein
MLSPAVLFAGSRAAMPSWISTDGGASTGTAARGGGSKDERVPRTGWRFVCHLNRLSALAFLRPVRKVSLGAEFPTPFRESILRPGLPTPLPRAGRAEHTGRVERRLGSRFVALGKSEIFALRPQQKERRGGRGRRSRSGSSLVDDLGPVPREGLPGCAYSVVDALRNASAIRAGPSCGCGEWGQPVASVAFPTRADVV